MIMPLEQELFYKLRQPLETKDKKKSLSVEEKIKFYALPLICISALGVAGLWFYKSQQGFHYLGGDGLVDEQKLSAKIVTSLPSEKPTKSVSQSSEHYLFLARSAIEKNQFRQAFSSYLRAANVAILKKNYTQADDSLIRAYVMMTQKIDPKEYNAIADDIVNYYDLGSELALKQDKGNDALNLARKALEYSIKFFGENSVQVAQHYELLAFFYEQMGENEKSLLFRHNALLIFQDDPKGDWGTLLIKMNNLGEAYRIAGDYNKAKEVISDTIQRIEKKFGSHAPELAIPLNNLALVHIALGERTIAEAYLTKAYDIAKKYQGTNNPITEYIAENLNYLERL